MNLTLFTQPQILHQVGRKLLAEFFARFTHLLASQYSLPNPKPDNDSYFESLAWTMERPQELPAPLAQALYNLEAAAAALHRPEAISPDDPASNPENTASDRLQQAIELWLVASKQREAGHAAAEQRPAEGGPVAAKQVQPTGPVSQPLVAPKSDEGGSTINSQPSTSENTPHSDGPDAASASASLTSLPSVKESGGSGHPEVSETPHSEPSPLSPLPPVQNSGTNGHPEISGTPHPEAPHFVDPSIQQSTNPASAAPSLRHSSTPPLQESDSAAFVRLARLPLHEYDRLRRAEAKRLHLRLASLDDAVDHARLLEDDAQANDIYLSQLKPWPEPILDAPALFDEIHARFPVYLWLPPGAAVVFTFWAAHAHAFDAFTLSPRLNLTSIDPGCGKSTVLSVLATMCPKVLRTDNLKTAVLFRVVDLYRPTLLLDELDSYLHLYPELRGLLNASNTDDACVFRCEGHALRAFKAYAPIALAGIGHLSPTLHHRSIVISLSEAPPGALLTRFDKRRIETEKTLGGKLARWTQDNFAALAACDPVMPPAAHNRLADKWRPLFAIAQVVGGHWPARTLEAFHALNPPHSEAPSLQHSSTPSLPPSTINHQPSTSQAIPHSDSSQLSPIDHQLLSDLRSIFAQAGTDRLFSATILARLRALPGRPWSLGHNGHKPIDQTWLALQLRPLGVTPHNLRIGGNRARGYDLASFTQPFARFLGDAPNSPG